MNAFDILEYDEQEAKRLLRQLGLKKDDPSPGLLGQFQGRVDAVCRNEDGSVDWEIHQKNIVTDATLRRFAYGWHTGSLWSGANQIFIFLSPSSESPLSNRYTLPDDGTGIGYATSSPGGVGMSPSYNASTLTWTYSYTFSGGNRQIGTIGLGAGNNNTNFVTGATQMIWAYTLINPVKTQTSSQTVETVYRITLIPLY